MVVVRVVRASLEIRHRSRSVVVAAKVVAWLFAWSGNEAHGYRYSRVCGLGRSGGLDGMSRLVCPMV